MKMFMTFTATAIALFAFARSAAAQTSSGGAPTQVSTEATQVSMNPIGGSAGGFYGPTADSGFLIGKAAFAMGLGQYNYNTALAARQLQEADKEAIQNDLFGLRTYFEKKRLNDEYWASKHPPMTPEQNLLVEQSRVPRRLTASELDPTWNVIRWPLVLERPEFETVRQALEDAFAHRNDGNFGIGSPAYNHIKELTRDMRSILDQEYDSMSQMEWIQAMRFIESLAYEPRFAPGTAVGVNLR